MIHRAIKSKEKYLRQLEALRNVKNLCPINLRQRIYITTLELNALKKEVEDGNGILK